MGTIGLLAAALLCALSASGRADVRIEGTEAALRITADQAPIGDILAALTEKFRLRYRTPVDAGRQISGTISGTLHRVVVRLLDGYDFVVRRSSDGVEIVQVAPRGTADTLRVVRSSAPVWRSSMAQASAQKPR